MAATKIGKGYGLVSEERRRKAALEPIYGAVGARMGETRRNQGLTQEQVAEAVGVSQNLLARFEAGSRRIPLHTLEAIAGVLKVKLLDLLPPGVEPDYGRLHPGLAKALQSVNLRNQFLLQKLATKLAESQMAETYRADTTRAQSPSKRGHDEDATPTRNRTRQ